MKKDNGFIGILLLIIVGLTLAKYFFNWSIFDAAASEQGRGTIIYIRDVLNTAWSYIRDPIVLVWEKILEIILSSVRAL